MKKVIKFVCLVFVILIFFLIGLMLGEKNIARHHFAIYAQKSLHARKDYFKVTGEMAALDFEPGFKQRAINFQCKKSDDQLPICAWAELGVLNSNGVGFVMLNFIEPNQILEWSTEKFKAIINDPEGKRTIEVHFGNQNMYEIHRHNSGSIKNTHLVGTHDKSGSYNTLRK